VLYYNHHHHHLFSFCRSIQDYKSKWIWKSSHFRENKEYNHYKVYINNKAQYNISGRRRRRMMIMTTTTTMMMMMMMMMISWQQCK